MGGTERGERGERERSGAAMVCYELHSKPFLSLLSMGGTCVLSPIFIFIVFSASFKVRVNEREK